MMSFRTRLTSFFVLIVVVPMAAVGFLVFRLIDDSQSGKADARASGVASTAASVYHNASMQASLRARTVAGDIAFVPRGDLEARTRALASQAGLARTTVTVGADRVVDIGDHGAIAPGIALVRGSRARPARRVVTSQLTAAQLARELAGPGTHVIVRSAGSTLATTLPAAARLSLPPSHGLVTVGHTTYQAVSQTFAGFDRSPVTVSILSDAAAFGGSVAADRVLAAIFIAGFLILAFFFSLLASRALHGQLARFLDAARRLAGGDFSSPVPTSGHDEFALLGEEFNNMSRDRKSTRLNSSHANISYAVFCLKKKKTK